MSGFNKMTIKEKEFQYDLDPDIIFNYTSDLVEYLYTKESKEHEEIEEIETIYAANLIPTKDLKIKFVLKCRNQKRLPILIIIAVDMLKHNYIFCYNVVEQQLTQASTKKPLEYKVTQASITQDPIKVAFMGSQMSDSETCYALVIGTENGTATLLLLKIVEPIFEASLLSIEPMVSEKEGASLGSVTAIHILHSNDGDKRMGHADPQIALGFSLGSILIYRFRANVYWSKASRFRPPVDLSEYTEFRDFPIKCISCTRSYNSLTMTVSFVQEKPHNVIKYQYSSTYVKIVEIHGNLTHKQRKIINPDEALADVMEARLLASSLKTEELDNIIQLSVLYEGAETFGLNIWHISPNNVHEELNVHIPLQTLMKKLLFRNKLRSDNCIGFYTHTPQKLVQRMLQDYSHPSDDHHSRASAKRRMDTDHHETSVKKKGRKKKVTFEDDTLTDVSEFEREPSTASTLEDSRAPESKNLNPEIEEEPVNEELDEPTLVETEELDEPTLVEKEELDKVKSEEPIVKFENTDLNKKAEVTPENKREIKNDVVNVEIESSSKTHSILTFESETQNKEVSYSPQYEDLLETVTNVEELSEKELDTLDSIVDLSSHPTKSTEGQDEKPFENNIEKDTTPEAEIDYVQVNTVETSINVAIETQSEKVESANILTEVVEKVEEIEKNAADNVSNQDDESNEIIDDYVLVESKDIPPSESVETDQIQLEKEEEEEEEEAAEEDLVAMDVDEMKAKSNTEYESESEQVDSEQADSEQADSDQLDSDQLDSDQLESDQLDEEMGDIPDYCDDAGESDEKSIPDNDECILLSSDDDEEEVEKHDMVSTADDVDSIMTESFSDVGSLQQSFVPATNSITSQDTPPLTQEQSNHQPVVDYVPVTQQDLLRLLQPSTDDSSLNLGTRESTVDSTSGYAPDQYTEYSTEHTQTPTSDGEILKVYDDAPFTNQESTDYIESSAASVQSLAEDTSNKDTDERRTESVSSNDEFSECIEMEEDQEEQQRNTIEKQHQHEIEQRRVSAYNDFSNMLYEIFGDESIDDFMNKSNILQEKLDEIGSSCWFNPNPHMKLLLLRYCSKHNMAKESVLLCRLLLNTTTDFTKEEIIEYKNIYRKYLRECPSYHHGEVVNIFHGEGRQRLLEREMNYYKSNQSTINEQDEKQKKSYIKYYGFGLRY